jgi:arylsulfatase A-like enzyme
MKPPGIVVIEYRPKRAEIPDRIGEFIRFDERGYDATHLGFWHLGEKDEKDEKGERDA